MKELSDYSPAELAEMAPSELSGLQQRDISRRANERRQAALKAERERQAQPPAKPRRGRPPKNAPAPLAPPDADNLEALRDELLRHGALTRQDRIAMATKWARNSDPQVALPWAKFLEMMDTKAESDNAYGIPPPTNAIEQTTRLSTLMMAVGMEITRNALDLCRSQWRMNGELNPDRLPELPRTPANRSDPPREEPADHRGTGSIEGETAGTPLAAPYDR